MKPNTTKIIIYVFAFSKVANPGESPGNRYNIQLINALVMHVGTSAIQFIRSKGKTVCLDKRKFCCIKLRGKVYKF